MCIYMYVYIYIYIEREREGESIERERETLFNSNTNNDIHNVDVIMKASSGCCWLCYATFEHTTHGDTRIFGQHSNITS